jgi:hypothetical protein
MKEEDKKYHKYEVSVGFMTERPEVGHFEYELRYSVNVNEPSRQDILDIITPHVLQQLRSDNDSDWIITTHPVNEFGELMYTFHWKNLNNKMRVDPLMRTVTFREHLHRFTIDTLSL